jgi:hypothetical protein
MSPPENGQKHRETAPVAPGTTQSARRAPAASATANFKGLLRVSRCAVNTHACTFNPSGGGPKQSGKLADCEVCTAQASGTEWRCLPASIRQVNPVSPDRLQILK